MDSVEYNQVIETIASIDLLFHGMVRCLSGSQVGESLPLHQDETSALSRVHQGIWTSREPSHIDTRPCYQHWQYSASVWRIYIQRVRHQNGPELFG